MDHEGPLVADFRRFYGIRLFAVLGTDDLPWCEFRTLVEHLPADAVTVRREMGAKASWGVGEQLLAHVLHAVQVANWQRSGPKAGRPPEPIGTPWQPSKQDIAADMARRLIERRTRGD